MANNSLKVKKDKLVLRHVALESFFEGKIDAYLIGLGAHDGCYLTYRVNSIQKLGEIIVEILEKWDDVISVNENFTHQGHRQLTIWIATDFD